MNSIVKFFSLLGLIVTVAFSLWVTPSIGADREIPLVAYQYGLEIEGKLSGFFTSVDNIGSESEVIEHRVVTSTGEEITQKVPGRLSYTDVVLAQGMTSSTYLWDWRQLVVDGKINDARMNFSIIAYDQTNAEIARWSFTNGWPSKITSPKGAGSSFMVETITLVHEGVSRLSIP